MVVVDGDFAGGCCSRWKRLKPDLPVRDAAVPLVEIGPEISRLWMLAFCNTRVMPGLSSKAFLLRRDREVTAVRRQECGDAACAG